MRVFNLTNQIVDYRGRHIGAYGSVEIPDLTFIPNRDRFLADKGMLAFGALPAGWKKPEPPKPAPEPVPAKAEVKLVESVKVEAAPVKVDAVKVDPPAADVSKDEFKSEKKSKK